MAFSFTINFLVILFSFAIVKVISKPNPKSSPEIHGLNVGILEIVQEPNTNSLSSIESSTTSTSGPSTSGIMGSHELEQEDPAVTRLREYLRIDTSHPTPNYDDCVDWLKKQAEEIGLEFHIVHFHLPGLFTVWLTWPGTDPDLKSIMLNSHIDVVPADPTSWKYPPFSAFKEPNGDIYARGAQDRKSLGVQYLEAIKRLKATGFVPRRNIHVTFVPDEERMGHKGMEQFIQSNEFKALNIGCELDEGGVTPGDEYAVYYGERAPWQFKVTAKGRASHAAMMLKDNAAVKLNKVITKLLNFREEQMKRIDEDPSLEQGDITSINLSQLGGGLQPNVVPSQLWAIFDMRIKIGQNWTFDDVKAMLDQICAEAGPGVTHEFILRSELFGETELNERNIWWTTFKSTFDHLGKKLIPKYFPSATDARYLRNANYTAFGFTPLPHTEAMQHQDDEHINEKTFLEGIKIYEDLIPRLANVTMSEFD